MKFSKLLLLSGRFVLASFMVTACVKPSERSGEPNADFSGEQPAATFFNGEVSGGATVSKNAGSMSVGAEKLFHFKTCVQDKRTREAVKGHKFDIQGAVGVVEVTNNGRSDESGCVNWTEAIAYNGVADAKYILLKRSLVANGMHRGSRNLTICINPWDNGGDQVRDCMRNPVPASQLADTSDESKYNKTLNGQSKSGASVGKYLWIDDLRLNPSLSPGSIDGAAVDFSFGMGPKVLSKDLRGATVTHLLTDGEFAVEMWVIAKNNGATPSASKCYILGHAATAPGKDVPMVGARLRDELKMRIRYQSTYGQLELVGKVIPKKNGLDVRPFQGIWLLGSHNDTLGMKFGFERPPTYREMPEGFDALKYANGCQDITGLQGPLKAPKSIVKAVPPSVAPHYTMSPNGEVAAVRYAAELEALRSQIPAELNTQECVQAEDLPKLFHLENQSEMVKLSRSSDLLTCPNTDLPSGIAKIEQFEFDNMAVRPEPISRPGTSETTTERTIKYRVTTTVRNPLDRGSALRDIDFEIVKSDGSKENVRSNPQGQIIFNDEVHHKYFQPERYILKAVTIRQPESGFSKQILVVMNPWDNEGFTFGRDIREMKKAMIAEVNLVPRPKSELLLPQFQWGTQGFRYEVDKFMNLRMFKQFNLTLSPRVLRYSSLVKGRMMNEMLRDGIYLMKVAIQKDYEPLNQGKKEYITAIRRLVRVASGMIITPVEMEFRDFRILKLRANLLIELQTINEKFLNPVQRQRLEYPEGKLDTLVDKESGLASRTFVGPVIAYSNGFSSSMRPTDDLSETICGTIDCDEVKAEELKQLNLGLGKHFASASQDIVASLRLASEARGNYQASLNSLDPQKRKEIVDEEKKYTGDIKHLKDKDVGDMIARRAMLDQKEIEKALNEVRLSNILKFGNLEYAAIYNEGVIAKNEGLAQNNQYLQNGSAFVDLVNRFAKYDTQNQSYFPSLPRTKVSQQDIVNEFQNSLSGAEKMSLNQAIRFCVFFMEDLVLQPNDRNGMEASAYAQRGLRSLCVSELMAASRGHGSGMTVSDVLQVEPIMRVFEIAKSKPLGGTLTSLGVGASHSVDTGKSYSKSKSGSWSPVAWLEEIIKLIPLGDKFLDAAGLSYSISISGSESESSSEGVSVNNGLSLAVEMRGMQLDISKYERCAVIRISPSFSARNGATIVKLLSRNVSQGEVAKRMARGLLLCEGVGRQQAVRVDERYYQFSQVLGDEVINDPTAMENHPYLFSVRGRMDYNRLVDKIEAKPIQAIKMGSSLVSHMKLPTFEPLGELPTEHMMRAFGTEFPTMRGVIRLDPGLLKQVSGDSTSSAVLMNGRNPSR